MLALYVLSFLEPKDLLQAAQTCRYWRILAEDNLLWREKCREEGIDEPLPPKKRKVVKPGFTHSPWKSAYIRQHRIDTNWRRGDLKSPKPVISSPSACLHLPHGDAEQSI
uniref:F-box domain-containing protein n=1 Tax=Knipowitschia caucasica TaxID=637954 RepID=A0AAV2LF54_KNICA